MFDISYDKDCFKGKYCCSVTMAKKEIHTNSNNYSCTLYIGCLLFQRKLIGILLLAVFANRYFRKRLLAYKTVFIVSLNRKVDTEEI